MGVRAFSVLLLLHLFLSIHSAESNDANNGEWLAIDDNGDKPGTRISIQVIKGIPQSGRFHLYVNERNGDRREIFVSILEKFEYSRDSAKFIVSYQSQGGVTSKPYELKFEKVLIDTEVFSAKLVSSDGDEVPITFNFKKVHP